MVSRSSPRTRPHARPASCPFSIWGAIAAGPAAFGKAVVYARRDVVIGDTHSWLARDDIRDIPHPGEHIRAGRPVCTVFATGRDSGMCHQALVGCASQIYAQLDAWEP